MNNNNNSIHDDTTTTPSISGETATNNFTETTSRSPYEEYQLSSSNQTAQGKRIVDTLWELELENILGEQHTQAIHQLIVAVVVIALISIVLIATVLLFRCYMLYCQDYLNTRRYQQPPGGTELQAVQQRPDLDSVPAPLVPRHPRRHKRPGDRASFHAVFDDESPFIKVK